MKLLRARKRLIRSAFPLATLARECNKVGVVDIQRSGMPLMKTKFCKNSAAENDVFGCFNSSIQLSLCQTEADKRLLLAGTAELASAR